MMVRYRLAAFGGFPRAAGPGDSGSPSTGGGIRQRIVKVAAICVCTARENRSESSAWLICRVRLEGGEESSSSSCFSPSQLSLPPPPASHSSLRTGCCAQGESSRHRCPRLRLALRSRGDFACAVASSWTHMLPSRPDHDTHRRRGADGRKMYGKRCESSAPLLSLQVK